MSDAPYTRRLDELTKDDVELVGGKNASLGEMIRELSGAGIHVPGGFATTSRAYRELVADNDLDEKIRSLLDDYHQDEKSLAKVGKAIRKLFAKAEFPERIAQAIRDAYADLCEREGKDDVSVAVRSSATAEDLPHASFAGQQETFLNVRGADNLLEACRECYASLFTDRAITYRENQGFDHMDVALSIGVQRMVRSDKAGSGVMFTIDTETGFPDTVIINAAWGLGETVVQGRVTPDQYTVFKPFLGDGDLVPILRKDLGNKRKKMIYAETVRAAPSRPSRPRRRSGARSCSRTRRSSPWPAGAHHRGALRPAHGHRVGQGRRHGEALHRPGAAGDRPVPASRRPRSRPTGSTSTASGC